MLNVERALKQFESGQHGGKDNKRRHHIQAEEVDEMEHERMSVAVLGVTPVFVGDAFERDDPVACEAPAPIPRSNEQQDNRDGPYAGIECPEQKSYRRKDAPIRIIDRHVLIE